MNFFWRIFLSAWAIVLITISVTLWAAGWLPQTRGTDDARFAEQMVSLVAGRLAALLAADPTTAADVLAEEQSLDFSPLLEIYVLDPAGKDILGRPLPSAIANAATPQANSAADADLPFVRPLYIRDDGLAGYRVIGEEGYFPMSDVLLREGGRWLLIVLALTVSVVVSLLLARFIVLPVRRLMLAEQKVAAGDLSVRIAHTVGSRTDDIARLARDFDVMTERVDALLQSRQRLLRDVSHELRSPLARLQALLSIARQKDSMVGPEQFDRMENELERLDQLIGEILAYSRLEAQEGIVRRPVDVVDLVRNIVDDASLEGAAAGKDVLLKAPDRCLIDIDSSLMQSAIENIVRNAVKHTADDTAVTVSVEDDRDKLRILVDDEGPGVPDESLHQIFEPFFRIGDSRSTQSGTGGIGLAIARRSVRLHGGIIDARNRDGEGLRVTMMLPKTL